LLAAAKQLFPLSFGKGRWVELPAICSKEPGDIPWVSANG